MSLTKNVYVGQIEVSTDGTVHVRTTTEIVENGIVLSSSFHRSCVQPGHDYSGEDDRVQAVCAAVQTPEVIAAFEAEQARIAAELEAIVAVQQAAQEVQGA